MKYQNLSLKFKLIVVSLALVNSPGQSATVNEKAIQPSALAQIKGILTEKAVRTPSESKIDSNLLNGMRAIKQKSAGISQTQPTYVQNFLQKQVSSDSTVKVTIRGKVSNDLLAALKTLNASEISSFPKYDTLTARLPIAELTTISSRSDVSFVEPFDPGRTNRYIPTPAELSAWQTTNTLSSFQLNGPIANVGNATSEGVIAHAADKVQKSGIDGTGVKVCVLSDGVNSLAARQATGDLPAAVDVVAGQAGLGDEGTAMLEIIHDLAPGAALGFATGFNGDAQMATNIQTLRNPPHLCDIIVDDVTYYLEPPFQEGIIAQAVSNVTSNGAVYFSSSANSGSKTNGTSGTWEGDFVNSGTSLSVIPEAGTVHLFNGSNANTITKTGNAYILTWGDPQNASTNDYDLFILDSGLTKILAQSTNRQTGSTSPWEGFLASSSIPIGSKIVVINYQGNAQIRALRLDTQRGQLSVNTNGNTYGHNGGVNTITTAAVYVGTAGGGSFTGGTANPVELYSSDGPRRLFFSPSGIPLTTGNILFGTNGGTLLNKVNIASADCVVTTTPGFFPFCGTSAAAPHAAAIAALLKSANPTLPNTKIKNALSSTALDIEALGFDYNAGSGLIMADASVRSTLNPIVVTGTFTPNTIFAKGISTLTISLYNPNGVALQNIAISDAYPTNLINFAIPNALLSGSGCAGNVTATANGTTLGLTGVTIPANSTCNLIATVTSSVANTYSNSTGLLTTPMGLNTNGVNSSLQVNASTAKFKLTVTPSNGVVKSTTPTGIIDCGSLCSTDIDQGTAVILTATPNTGYTFSGWSGACTTDPCIIIMDSAKTVFASFNNASYPLTVAKIGNGTITSTPTGINCGTTCSANFNSGTQVTLKATPTTGYAFGNWSGCNSITTTGDCLVTMSAANSVSTSFNPILTLTVGTNGKVSSNPAGIACNPTCSKDYPLGTTVTLTATPNESFVLEAWGGACSGNGSCVVTMNAPTTVSASFVIAPWMTATVDYIMDDSNDPPAWMPAVNEYIMDDSLTPEPWMPVVINYIMMN